MSVLRACRQLRRKSEICLSRCKRGVRGDRICDLGGYCAAETEVETCHRSKGLDQDRIILPAEPCLCRVGPVPSFESSVAGEGAWVAESSSIGLEASWLS